MTTISFYARGDGSTANNASLNVESKSQQPTVLITFNSGPTGDIILEANGGAADPDTTVTINGTTYNFVVEQTGNLPIGHPKVPDPLEGKEITVISVVIGGKTERFFFVNDGTGSFALMEQIGNGAIALDNTNTNPPPVYICFCAGTDILTPGGYRNVETLQPGDLVLTDAGASAPILWIGQSRTTREEMRRDPSRRPVRIPAHSIRLGAPQADLYVSAQHRVVLQDVWAELLFGEARIMVAASHLVGPVAEWVEPAGDITYYHILLPRHEVLVANGLATESFQPSVRSIVGVSEAMCRSLADAFAESELRTLCDRPDAMLTLKRYEAGVLMDRMFGQRGRRIAGAPTLPLAA